MEQAQRSKDRSPLVTDERFNTASHLAGTILSVLGAVLLIVEASVAARPWHIVSFSIYGASLIMVFLASTLHHGINASQKVEEMLRLADYLAIYLLIAGTFTPICLVVLRGSLGWSVFGVSWGVAAAGIALRVSFPRFPKWVSMTLYVTMGWLGGVLAYPAWKALGTMPVALVAIGGIMYTIGAVIFSIEKPNPAPGRFGFHEIWHIFVLLGASFHWATMYLYLLPWSG